MKTGFARSALAALLAICASLVVSAWPARATPPPDHSPPRETRKIESFGTFYTASDWRWLVESAEREATACEDGDQASCVRLADRYYTGEGVVRMAGIAILLYQDACEAGHGDGCRGLGALSLDAYLAEVDPVAATDMYRQGCELGSAESCIDYASALESGYAGAPDESAARLVLEKSCAGGGMPACGVLAGEAVRRSSTRDEKSEALQRLLTLCGDGLASACNAAEFSLASEVDQNPRRIAALQERGCEAGDAETCWRFATSLVEGATGEPDPARARQILALACAIEMAWCDRANAAAALPAQVTACEGGDADACLATAHGLGELDTPFRDPVAARDLLVRKCREGLEVTCGMAGVLLAYGNRSEEEDALLPAILDRGCALDQAEACEARADLLQEGRDEQRDEQREGRLYAKACRLGSWRACEEAQTYAGVVPEVAIREADFLYIPPTGPDGREVVSEELAALLKSKHDEQKTTCPMRETVFRGIRYRSDKCYESPRAMGSYKMRPGQAPWQALLWRPPVLDRINLSPDQRVLCGASLVATGWVLTAAHCLDDYGSIVGSGHRVRLGVHNPRADEGMSYPIVEAIRHPAFTTRNYAFDIALVRYDPTRGVRMGPVNSIRSISLDPLSIEARPARSGIPVYSYGWGLTKLGGRTTDYLQGVRMELRSEADCRKITGFRSERLKDAVLCAAGKSNQTTCNGDSGGPLVHYGAQPTLIGVVSGGKACGTTGVPSRYPRVAKVRQWIESEIR